MAKQDRISMPSSGAGLTRFFGDYKSKIEIAPGHVIVLAAVIGLLVLLLHRFGPGWLGLP
ncbi:MAG: preprotein translocase subunit Sec61beta [Nanoarchaeota archaeon]